MRIVYGLITAIYTVTKKIIHTEQTTCLLKDPQFAMNVNVLGLFSLHDVVAGLVVDEVR